MVELFSRGAEDRTRFWSFGGSLPTMGSPLNCDDKSAKTLGTGTLPTELQAQQRPGRARTCDHLFIDVVLTAFAVVDRAGLEPEERQSNSSPH